MNARVGVSIAATVASLSLIPGAAHAQSGFVRRAEPSTAQPQSQPVTHEQAAVSGGAAEVQANAGAAIAAPGAAADVAWEERTVRYTGGPIPPGAQLEERVNGPMVGGGAGAIVVGYLVGLYGMDARPLAAVPIVGPILAISGVAAPVDPITMNTQATSGGQIAVWVLSEVLQLGGAALFTLGLFMPKRSLVYDAPVTAPAAPGTITPAGRGLYGMRRERRARWAVVPAAPDSVAGATLVITAF
jgi:hypothetical protein